jgi:hypothetical protein
MTVRTTLASVALPALIAFIPACSAATTDTASSSTEALDADVVVEGSVAAGNAITVTYDPSDYAAGPVPFLGVRLTGKAAVVHVSGQFPGSPQVIALDDSSRIVAKTVAVATNAGAEASLELPSSASLVLVRDDIWVRPMPFTVAAE